MRRASTGVVPLSAKEGSQLKHLSVQTATLERWDPSARLERTRFRAEWQRERLTLPPQAGRP